MKNRLLKITCPNTACKTYNQAVRGNIIFWGCQGQNNTQLYYCKACGHTFKHNKGTPLWNRRIGYGTIETIFKLALAGMKIDCIAQEIFRGNSLNTIRRYLCLAGESQTNFKFFVKWLHKKNGRWPAQEIAQELFTALDNLEQARLCHHRSIPDSAHSFLNCSITDDWVKEQFPAQKSVHRVAARRKAANQPIVPTTH